MSRFPEWSRRLRASDATACAELFDHVHKPLIRYAARLTGDEDAAYDVVQDAFSRLWEKRPEIDPDQSLQALLYRITRNLALNHNRMIRKHRASLADAPMPAEEVSPEEIVSAEMLEAKLRSWIDELPERRREALVLSRFAGLSHAEIAEVMDLAPRTVTNHIMLALTHLSTRLKEYER